MASRKVFFRSVDHSGAYGIVDGAMSKPSARADTPQGVRPKKGDLPVTVQDRVRELMKALTEQEPYRGHGAITRLAIALKVSQPAVSQILSGGGVSVETAMSVAELAKVDPRELLGGAYVGVAVGGRFPNLEVCLAYHGDKWPSPVVAAARAGAYPNDAMPDEWAARLSALDEAISVAIQRESRPEGRGKGAR
jgi:transcriptional regulator with XRE-family HTH domain